MLNVGVNIKEYRLKKGYTQEQLANELGVSPQTVSRWETGITYPDIVMLPVIAELFGTSIDHLLGYAKTCTKEERRAFFCKMSRLEAAEKIESHRQMLKEFPNDTYIQFSLANLIFYQHVRKKKDVEAERELKRLCNRVIQSNLADMQCGAKRLLALLAAQNGDKEEAMQYVNQLPSVYCGREIMAEQILHDLSFRKALDKWLLKTEE